MKPFNLEEAKAGKPVCTRAGLPVRIIDYDALIPHDGTLHRCLLVQITDGEKKITAPYNPNNGRYLFPKDATVESTSHLQMGNRFIGWQNIVDDGHGNRIGSCIWKTREEAEKNKPLHCVSTIKIFWEEEDEN